MSRVRVLQGANGINKGNKMKTNELPEQKNSMGKFFKDLKAEWGKISWPQKPQIVSETFVVLIVVTFFTIVVLLYDKIFSLLLGLFNK